MTNKQRILNLFYENIKGKQYNGSVKHDGGEGHWLETLMNIKHNNRNEPDIDGFEMKKISNKITFGDFSASEYVFSKKRELINKYNNWTDEQYMNRDEFIKTFGTLKPDKHRYSWSGSCIPKYGEWNDCGQKLHIDRKNNIGIFYCYSKDMRENKINFPDYLKKHKLLIAVWHHTKMEKHINMKFNSNGFFIINKTKNIYDKISFGKPFDFNTFIDNIKNGSIIFDSGMHIGNNRNYSQFRSNYNNFWNKLIIEEFN